MVIELTNVMLFDLLSPILSISFEEFDKKYTEIKLEIVNKAKHNYSNWYKAYKLGQSFKPIDLSTLDKIHKPAG